MKPLDPLAVDMEKTTLIEASAGTGKTYTITTLMARLIAHGYAIESILVVTFTEAAAAELKLRIRTRLRDTLKALETGQPAQNDLLAQHLLSRPDSDKIRQRLALSLSCFDQAAVMTIHSFCLKVLKEYSFESRSFFDIELMPDRTAFLTQAGYDFFMNSVNDRDPLFLDYLSSCHVTPESFIASFKQALSRPDMVCQPKDPGYTDFYDDYRQTLSRLRNSLYDQAPVIAGQIQECKGLDKRSYSKKNVPSWLDAVQDRLKRETDPLFVMHEKGDPLYKFTRERLDSKLKPGHSLPAHPFFDACQDLLEVSFGFEDNLKHLKHAFISFLKQEFENIKQTRGICFFDDLINDLSQLLKTEQGGILKQSVQQHFGACLIDEFQDTDPGQYDIFAHLFSGDKVPFFMIGDPKQAIYAFRGGDIFAYLKAVRQCDQRFTLDQNWRSAPLLVQAVNELFSCVPDPFIYDQIQFARVGTPASSSNRLEEAGQPVPPLQIGFVERGSIEPDRSGYIKKQDARKLIPSFLASDILDLFNSGYSLSGRGGETRGIRPDDIAVLVRTNRQAGQVQQALSDAGIPSYQSSTGSVFDSDQATCLKDILEAVMEPKMTPRIRAALCTPVFGFDARDLAAMDADEHIFAYWQTFFHHCRRIWDEKGFVPMIMALFHSQGAFLKGNARLTERALTNLYHLVELISQAGLKFKFSPFHLMQWYLTQLDETRRDRFADELRLESDKKAVAIVTIHKSKGLEYPVVYLPYLWEGARPVPAGDIVYHDPDQEDCLVMDIGSDRVEKAQMLSQKEMQAEERRLLYVALTRSAALCRILWGGFASVETSSLGAILHRSGCKTDDTMIEDLSRLCARVPESIALYMAAKKASQAWEAGPDIQPDRLAARKAGRTVAQRWRVSSFSAMVRSAESGEPHPEPAVKDTSESRVITLEEFPKGANAGDFFHAVFEHIDFTGSQSRIKAEVAFYFSKFGFSDEKHRKDAFNSILDVLATPLSQGPAGFRLNEIGPDMRLNEMGFTLPVNGLDLQKIVTALGRSNPAVLDSGYPDALSRLQMPAVDGFLKGFADLVVKYQNRFFIIDYKSNYLGATYEMYARNRLPAAMASHHYFLQYHIYLLALHRYLAVKLPDYDYNTHIGGVYYLFIRGMHPEYQSKNGVFFDCPPQQVIHSLSECI